MLFSDPAAGAWSQLGPEKEVLRSPKGGQCAAEACTRKGARCDDDHTYRRETLPWG